MKKFCLVIAVILVFVVSCDNLYNDVAEEKKDMQKLIFVNADGVSVDLTKDPFGITEWEGFSKVDLNLQTQQVPFHDGSVYLDGLLSERELSVTLAMNDDKNLEKRYRLRRELTEILNPKLGEGTLIYTNNYTSKQIKVIPQTPLFETHNSNDSGTPKASLAWTACDPYWEDEKEILIPLKIGIRKTITNNGDVPCAVDIHLFTNDVTNPQIKNFTEDKLIKLNGSYNSNININTNFGQKSVSTESIKFKINNLAYNLRSVTYSEFLGLFVAVGDCQYTGYNVKGAILTSPDAVSWTSINTSGVSVMLTSVTCSETMGLFVAVGGNGTILTSPNAVDWTTRTSGVSQGLSSVTYSEALNIFVAVGGNGTILTSPDGINWTSRSSGVSVTLSSIVYSETKFLFVAVGNGGTILTSPDGINWTSRTSGTEHNLLSVTYSKSLSMFVAVGGETVILTSPNAVDWTSQDSGLSGYDELLSVTYAEPLGLFVAVGQVGLSSEGIILTSSDGTNWTRLTITPVSYNPYSVIYSELLGLFVIVGLSNQTFTSLNGTSWLYRSVAVTGANLTSVAYSEPLGLFVAIGGGIFFTSSDAINWDKGSSINTISNFFVGYFEKQGIFIMTGRDNYYGYGTILTSPDGINWTTVWTASASLTLTSVTYAEPLGLFVAVGYDGTIVTSPDGINWTLQSSGESVHLKSVTYAEPLGLFVAVGQVGSSSAGIILTSSDGINWTASNVNHNLYSIIYVESLNIFVTSGSNSFSSIIMTSPNGTNWTTTYVNYTLKSLFYTEPLGLFVGVGSDIYTSPNGTDWTCLDAGVIVGLSSVSYSKSLNTFVVVGNKGAILSSVFTSMQNLIADLTSDSDMSLSLEIGDNVLFISKSSGNLNGAVRYRQKYIGV